MLRHLLHSSPSIRAILDPGRLRVLIRRSEFGLIAAAVVVGVLAGLAVAAMSWTSQALHRLMFKIPSGERLSAASEIDPFLVLVAPVIGGVLLGVVFLILREWRKKPMVDPIEANALHGGRLSLTDSIIVAVQNLISNGFGASVGLEAGYTQLSSGLASKIGYLLQLRRADLRVLVGCGAAGAIAAAFNAPLTGAFYAFELIIGTYTIVSLAPVVVSALIATIITRLLFGDAFMIDVGDFGNVVPADYLPAIVLGIFCAGAGILLMKGVTVIEETARKSSVSPTFRPALGGIVVGLMALIDQQVLSAGHGALHLNLGESITIPTLLMLLTLKAVASAVSIGSGFRGGLFFASLFIGALLGKLFAYSAPYVFAHATVTPVIYAVVGMSALAVAVIGGPLTMTFLALEVTGDFPITALALAAVITSSITARMTFGYSFATWRFHLRGETDPQRPRRRLDSQSHGVAHDACRCPHGLRRHALRGIPQGVPAGLDTAGHPDGRDGKICRHCLASGRLRRTQGRRSRTADRRLLRKVQQRRTAWHDERQAGRRHVRKVENRSVGRREQPDRTTGRRSSHGKLYAPALQRRTRSPQKRDVRRNLEARFPGATRRRRLTL